MNIEHQDPLWLKKIVFFFICVETLISSFYLILFTIRNIKNDEKITFFSFYPHLHKILTNYANSTNNIMFSAKDLRNIYYNIFQKAFKSVEQSYYSRILRIMWNVTHSNCFFICFVNCMVKCDQLFASNFSSLNFNF